MTVDEDRTPQADVGQEQIEGLGDDQPDEWGSYPIDTLLIRNESRTVHEVLRRIEQERFVMDPDFQRDFIWDQEKQSRFIESVLMRIPLPVFYLAEDDQGRMIVVDGLQRLSTFRHFVNNDLRLRLENRPEINGKIFNELSPKLQNRVEDCNLILYVIDAKAHEKTRLDIFERVNSGVPLTRQQMRNCLYMGPATRFLREESQTDLFLKATGKSLRSTTMRDREFVNRFCAFQILSLDHYRDMDEFLAQSLLEMNSRPENLKELSAQFKTTLQNNLHLFQRHAFRKHEPEQTNRNVINASLWDVMSTGLSRYDLGIVMERSPAVKKGFYQLLNDEEFMSSITLGTSDSKRVRLRFEMTEAMLEESLGAY